MPSTQQEYNQFLASLAQACQRATTTKQDAAEFSAEFAAGFRARMLPDYAAAWRLLGFSTTKPGPGLSVAQNATMQDWAWAAFCADLKARCLL